MSLSPEQIVAEEFRLRARGYDRDEVDAFLDRLADQVEAELGQRHSLEQRVTSLEGELAAAREREATLTRTLVTVQDAADRVRADAEAEVETLRTATERELIAIREQAHREADQLRTAAEDQAAAVRAAAADEAAQVSAHLKEVQHLDVAHRERLRAHLETQLEALDALPDPFDELLGRIEPGDAAVGDGAAAPGTSSPEPPEPSTEVAPVEAAGQDAPAAAAVVPPVPPSDGNVDPWRRSDEDGEVAAVAEAGGADEPDDVAEPQEVTEAAPSDGAEPETPDGDGDEDRDEDREDGHEERLVEPDPPIWS